MKKTLLIAFIFHSIIASAQNYQCLQSGIKHYFTNSNGYLRGIKIDSVRTNGADVLYYPFHTPRGRYPYILGYPTTLLDSNGGSWLGKKVIQQNDGTFLFDNLWNDTVIIKTQAHVGDSWIFYNDTTSRYYLANLTSVDTMTVLGVLDSIKKINLIVYDSTGLVPSDSINNFQIILSKNNGFIKAIDLYTFPYHAPDSTYAPGFDYYLDAVNLSEPWTSTLSVAYSHFTLIPFINPTWAQLYDRSTGDVFEYSVYIPSPTSYPDYCFDSVINKLSATDSIHYDYSGWIDTPYYHTYSTTHSQAFYNNLLIDTTLMPEQYMQPILQYYFPNDTTYCINGALYQLLQSEIFGNSWEDIYFESSGVQRTYKTGLGLVHYYDYDAGMDLLSDTTLCYYVKSGMPCGTYVPFTPTAVSNIRIAQNIYTIFPNPVSTELTISASDKITSIAITNLLGQAVYTHEYNSSKVQINVADLPTGIYFVKINRAEIRKFVKE